MQKPGERKDILGRLIDATDPMTGEKLDEIDLRTEAFSSMVAGSDSTSASLGFTFHHILTHPEIRDKLVKELRNAFPEHRWGSETPNLSVSQLSRLPYLQACIKESLRLTPPGTINLPRYVPAGGKILGGEYFGAGVKLSFYEARKLKWILDYCRC